MKNKVENASTDAKYGLLRDYDINAALIDIAQPLKAGPNSWDKVKDDQSVKDFDFWVKDHHIGTIIYPIDERALQWLYRHLPEDCPRWGALGFVVETNYLTPILQGMSHDGLISEDEYVKNMQEQELQNAAAHELDQGNY